MVYIRMLPLGTLLLVSSINPTLCQNPEDPRKPWVEFQNDCPFTVWPAIIASGGEGTALPIQDTGFQLDTNETRSVTVPVGFQGRMWGRLGCNFDRHGVGKCVTGDCDSQLHCWFKSGDPGPTLAEIKMRNETGDDFYDVSLVDGFDLPLRFEPVDVGNPGKTVLTPVTCMPTAFNLTGMFRKENFFDVPPAPKDNPNAWQHFVKPVKSDCIRLRESDICCIGEWRTNQTCKKGRYTPMANRMCPDAYGFAYDDHFATWNTRRNLGYRVTFCPRAARNSSMINHGHRLDRGDYDLFEY